MTHNILLTRFQGKKEKKSQHWWETHQLIFVYICCLYYWLYTAVLTLPITVLVKWYWNLKHSCKESRSETSLKYSEAGTRYWFRRSCKPMCIPTAAVIRQSLSSDTGICNIDENLRNNPDYLFLLGPTVCQSHTIFVQYFKVSKDYNPTFFTYSTYIWCHDEPRPGSSVTLTLIVIFNINHLFAHSYMLIINPIQHSSAQSAGAVEYTDWIYEER